MDRTIGAHPAVITRLRHPCMTVAGKRGRTQPHCPLDPSRQLSSVPNMTSLAYADYGGTQYSM